MQLLNSAGIEFQKSAQPWLKQGSGQGIAIALKFTQGWVWADKTSLFGGALKSAAKLVLWHGSIAWN